MADSRDEAYELARGLAQDALTEFAKGDKIRAERLVEQAVKTDRRAVEDVIRELDEEARVAPRIGALPPVTTPAP